MATEVASLRHGQLEPVRSPPSSAQRPERPCSAQRSLAYLQPVSEFLESRTHMSNLSRSCVQIKPPSSTQPPATRTADADWPRRGADQDRFAGQPDRHMRVEGTAVVRYATWVRRRSTPSNDAWRRRRRLGRSTGPVELPTRRSTKASRVALYRNSGLEIKSQCLATYRRGRLVERIFCLSCA